MNGNIGDLKYKLYAPNDLYDTIISNTNNAIWIIQSLSPTSESEKFDGLSYCDELNSYIEENVSDISIPLNEHIENAVFHMMDLYTKEINDYDELEKAPGAILTLLRYNEEKDRIEYFSIGDSPLLVKYSDEYVRICATDASSYKPDFNPNNQWCLSFNPEALDYSRQGYLAASEVEKFIICTMAFDQTKDSDRPSNTFHQVNENTESVVSSTESNVTQSQLWRQDNKDIGLVYGKRE